MSNYQLLMIGPSYNDKGGIATVVSNYLSYGLFEKYYITYLSSNRHGSNLTKVFSFISSVLYFFLILAKNKIKLIHIHSSSRGSFWRKSVFVLLAKFFGKPVILHIHGSEFQTFYNHESNNLKKAYIRKIMKASNVVLALSSSWKEWFENELKLDNVVEVVNSVNPMPTKGKEKEGEYKNVLFLGRIGERKGTFDLIRAFSAVLDKVPTARLMLGGDGDLVQAKELASSLNLTENVEFLGWVGFEDKVNYLKSASVFVLPSYNEGMPMSILEAMSAQLPIVSTTIGGIPQQIESGISGFLIEPGDIVSLSKALVSVLTNKDKAESMAIAAKNTYEEQFSPQVVYCHLGQVYSRFLGTESNAL